MYKNDQDKTVTVSKFEFGESFARLMAKKNASIYKDLVGKDRQVFIGKLMMTADNFIIKKIRQGRHESNSNSIQ